MNALNLAEVVKYILAPGCIIAENDWVSHYDEQSPGACHSNIEPLMSEKDKDRDVVISVLNWVYVCV